MDHTNEKLGFWFDFEIKVWTLTPTDLVVITGCESLLISLVEKETEVMQDIIRFT